MLVSFKKHPQEGDLGNEYNPLRNLVDDGGIIKDFRTEELVMDLTHPLQVDCQPSYDGTVNLIINDDKNPPRVINSRFTKIEGNRYKIITRNQRKQTNLYEIGKIDQQTRLFRTLNTTPKVQLHSIGHHGQLKGGNYIFYVKFGDEDENKTDFVAESGIISVFNGTEGSPKTVCGTLADERTNKSIKLVLKNIDTSFSKIYLYASRSTSDLLGVRKDEILRFEKPYKITDSEMLLTVTGYEDTTEIPEEDLNIKYLTANAVKTQTQVQNRLFFGNIEANVPNNTLLQNISYFIEMKCSNEEPDENKLGYVSLDYNTEGPSSTNGEYYNAQNIYYRLGYWPDEIYRLGIVYIMNDDTLSPVYNLRGCDFNKTETNLVSHLKSQFKETVQKEDFLNLATYENTYGVFKNKNLTVIEKKEVNPIHFEASFTSDIIDYLKKDCKVKGFFFVRQRRIPLTLAQGLEVGVNPNCYVPMLWDNNNYIAESFKASNNVLTTNVNSRLLKESRKQSSGLLCLDAMVNPHFRSMLNGQKFTLAEVSNTVTSRAGRRYKYNFNNATENKIFNSRLIYVDKEISAKALEDFCFSTKAGTAESVSDLAWWDASSRALYTSKTPKLIRGNYSPFIGTNSNLNAGNIYNIKIPGYSEAFQKEYFDIRGKDTEAFLPITDRFSFYDEIVDETPIKIYRGDCFINTVTIRLNRNFIDPDVPINDTIIDEDTWKKNYKGYYGAIYTNGREGSGDKQVDALRDIAEAILNKDSKEDNKYTKFYKINRADTNAVPLGLWVSFKCLSNYNLSMRTIDRSNTSEYALLGNPRTYYPQSGLSVKSAYKMAESELLNDGFDNTVGKRYNFKFEEVPYIKDQFDNRIMFSNIQVNDEFRNAYRIFQGLSYQDIDRQYGGIVKLLPWYSNSSMNLLAVFEHGVGIVPVNEKALMQTTTGQSIHMYGTGVLQRDVTVISSDFGSTWQDSIIKTPLAIYGVDTYAKKIWRVALDGSGIESISDMHIQQFLNDHITFSESEKSSIIALRNVKSHYNNYKGDVMFTFYDYEHNEEWNFCYNERSKKWTTRYSWIPLFSENINNQYFSFDKKRAEGLAYVDRNNNCEVGIITDQNSRGVEDFNPNISLIGYTNFNDVKIKTSKIKAIYYNEGYHTFEKELVVEGNNSLLISNVYLDNLANEIEGTILYYLVEAEVTPYSNSTIVTPFNAVISFIQKGEHQDELRRNGVFLHGRAGIYNELNYNDESKDNEILPTKWYEKQEPFEFEFVVSQPTGLHKIFDNLVIISNNVKPEEIEVEVIGDGYNFNKEGLYWKEHCSEETKIDHEFDTKYNPFKYSSINGEDTPYQISQSLDNAKIVWDHVLNTYSIRMTQKCKDITNPIYGRLHGNIHYKEDSWKLTLDSIKYRARYKVDNEIGEDPTLKETRLRDKYCKIRIKYSGKDQAIITSIKTLVTMSYA